MLDSEVTWDNIVMVIVMVMMFGRHIVVFKIISDYVRKLGLQGGEWKTQGCGFPGQAARWLRGQTCTICLKVDRSGTCRAILDIWRDGRYHNNSLHWTKKIVLLSPDWVSATVWLPPQATDAALSGRRTCLKKWPISFLSERIEWTRFSRKDRTTFQKRISDYLGLSVRPPSPPLRPSFPPSGSPQVKRSPEKNMILQKENENNIQNNGTAKLERGCGGDGQTWFCDQGRMIISTCNPGNLQEWSII